MVNFLLGSQFYVVCPFFWEAKVMTILESLFRYNVNPKFKCFHSLPHDGKSLQKWTQNANGMEENLSKRRRLVIGD